MDYLQRTKKWFQEKLQRKPIVFKDDLETEQDYNERWRSIYIIYFTMFLISLGFSIILTGVWPYLDKVIDKSYFVTICTQFFFFFVILVRS